MQIRINKVIQIPADLFIFRMNLKEYLELCPKGFNKKAHLRKQSAFLL